jgi:hypothetical protein
MFERHKSVMTVMAALLVTLLWSVFDLRGHMSAAIGWSGSSFHIIHGLDVLVWGILFCAFGRMSMSECIGVAMIGLAIIVAPDTIVSLKEGGMPYSLPLYKETLARTIPLTIVVAFALAWLNDFLSELDRRQEAEASCRE